MKTPEKNQGGLGNRVVFLSGSVPEREGFRKPAAAFLIEQAVVGLARAVFANGGRIVFGAHPSISPLVASVATEYQLAGSPEGQRRVIIYQSKAFKEVLPDHTWDMYRFGFADLIWTEARGGEHYRRGDAASRTCPLSLTRMRTRMITEQRPSWMIVIGGMEGVYEEVSLLQSSAIHASIYVAGQSGGVASLIAGQKANYPGVQILEERWREAGGEMPAGLDDPRYVPMPPYAAMMQWLIGEISRSPQEVE